MFANTGSPNQKQFLSAIEFNKTRFLQDAFFVCKTTGDILTANVIYHKNCMSNYIVKFERDVGEILHDNNDQCDNITL